MRTVLFHHADRQDRQCPAALREAGNFWKRYLGKLKHGPL
jgi:hypothetical protein